MKSRDRAGKRNGAETPASPAPSATLAPAPAQTGISPAEPASKARPLTLSARAWRRLGPHLGPEGWTPESLLEQLIADNLHRAYPEITYRGACVAHPGCYCSFDRISLRPLMRMKSSCGEFVIRVREQNESYVKWLDSYQRRGDPEAGRKAAEMCLFDLEQELQKIAPGRRVIYPEDFLVERAAPG